MDIARLNFSHGDQSDHEQVCRAVRRAAFDTGRTVGILADLQGPKIRLGRFAAGPVEWRPGDQVRITVDDVAGTRDRVSTTYKGLADDARPGDRLLIDDGRIGLRVTGVAGSDVVCQVVDGGTVSDSKGISVPGMSVSIPALTGKDIADLEFALGLPANLVALSFVRSPGDLDLVRNVMDRCDVRLPVIAKLETPEAVADLEAVVAASDGIMMARGDLGVELPLERVPVVQKRAVQTMTRIIAEAESGPAAMVPPLRQSAPAQGDLLTRSARDIGEGLGATALVAFTRSGDTVRRLARLHPRSRLLAFTPDPAVRNQLALTWGRNRSSSRPRTQPMP